MKNRSSQFQSFFSRGTRRHLTDAVAVIIVATLALGGILPAVAADSKSKPRKLTEDQKVIHLLNRLGYGPRPGDVERVKKLGIDKYIDQQLHPDRLDDSATEARLKGLESLNMTIAQVQDKYPAPQFLAREIGLRPPRANAGQPGAPNPQAQPGAPGDTAEDLEYQREMRQKVFAYYTEHGLKPPNVLLLELQSQKLIRAVYSERQLQEVMSDFWFNHFNIFWTKGADKWMTTDFEMNAIRPNTLGKFKDLLLATARSPAMLFYLDNFQSSSPDAQFPGRRVLNQRRPQGRNPGIGNRGAIGRGINPGSGQVQRERQLEREMQREQQQEQQQMTDEQRRRAQIANQLRNRKPGINENYAREIMELHTLGVDGGYTQKDVQEVARCFTGWTINQPRQNGTFIFRPFMHDNGEKTVLGHKIPSGGGMNDGETVVDILARHPSTARFIATKLVRRFVSDDPPASLVVKVAATYTKTDGDIREMLKTIFTSKEFFAPEAYRAKIKSPFELAASAVRALAGDTQASPMMSQFIAKMGQPLYLYQPPTGYPDRAEQWVNTGALLERLNFGLALSANRIRGAAVDPKKFAPGVNAADSKAVLDRALAALLNGDVSPETRVVLDRQLKEGVSVKGDLGDPPKIAIGRDDDGSMMLAEAPQQNRPGGRLERQGQRAERRGFLDLGNYQAPPPVDPQIAKVFGLVLGSPEFQRR
ncbi:MAG TPA: DUF1800 domain-containing protein [Blastocatellia bacterium]|nr:DUF1800 domain-containing protein [Blastocatellia bacterium]